MKPYWKIKYYIVKMTIVENNQYGFSEKMRFLIIARLEAYVILNEQYKDYN
jgi:hypothetical protein